MKKKMNTSALCLVMLGSVPLLAAPVAQRPAPQKPAAKKTDRLEMHLRLGGLTFDNFFQAPEGSLEDDVLGAYVEARLAFQVREGRPLRAYLGAEYIAYTDDFNPSSGITLGLRSEDKPHSWDVSGQYLKGRPSREVRDEFDRADVLGLNGQYSYRITEDFEVIGLGEYRHETFELSADKANDLYSLGPAVRYRGFGWRFSPEIGLRFGGRNVVDDNEDFSQRELFVRLRYSPTSALYLTLRYRHRSRDYSIGDAGAGNFGREDTRKQWTVTADWKSGETLTWNLYYALENSDSTRPVGVFQTQMLSLGLTIGF